MCCTKIERTLNNVCFLRGYSIMLGEKESCATMLPKHYY